MSSKNTIKIRAPKDIMLECRLNFPNVRDADLIRTIYNTSLIKTENTLRFINGNAKKKIKY